MLGFRDKASHGELLYAEAYIYLSAWVDVSAAGWPPHITLTPKTMHYLI